MTLENYLTRLVNGDKSVRDSELMILSNMSADEVGRFADFWKSMSPSIKEDLVSSLIEMSDNNFEADFDGAFRFCMSDNIPSVKAKAIEGLWECDDRTLITPLIDFLRLDPSNLVRAAAATALGKFAELSQRGKLLSKDEPRIKAPLIAVIQNSDENQEVRRRSIEAVAGFDTSEVRQIITDAYQSDEMEMKCSAIYAMGKSCSSEWLPTILTELNSPHPSVRYEASNACGELGEEESVRHLIPLMQDEDHQTQLSAISAIGSIGGTLARKALLHSLETLDEVTAEAAQDAIDGLDSGNDFLSFSSNNHN